MIAKYCVKDCDLVNVLTSKLEIITNNMAMAKVCHVPLTYLFLRGQGVKSFSLVSKKCRERGYLIPVLRKPTDVMNDEAGYEGAIVFDPVKGIHFEPIPVLDFNSLYPNSAREENISHETYVMSPKFDNLPGLKYNEVRYTEKGSDREVVCRYVANKVGIIPEILSELLTERKATQAKMKEETDPFKKRNLDGKQLALKITANSLYGQLGATTSPIYLKPLAASITAVGRRRLQFAKKVVEETYPGSKIIYGDSVTGNTPLILKDSNGKIIIDYIENIGDDNWESYDEFKSDDLSLKDKERTTCDLEVWTHQGWAKISKVIRHETKKKIYRVKTLTGVVDVTEDHSLLTKDLELIKPGELTTAFELFHSMPMPFEKIIDTLNENDAFKLGQKCPRKIPNNILNSSKPIIEAFLNGYLTTNKLNNISKGKGDTVKCEFEDRLQAQCMYYLLKICGYNVQINIYEIENDNDDDNIIFILTFMGPQARNPYKIKKSSILFEEYYDYVYDLETVAGTFHAGVGELIVKNTDSIFISFDIRDENGKLKCDDATIMEAIGRAKICEEAINKLVPPPQKIEYEKTFCPLILAKRKKYCGKKYMKDTSKFEIASMGMVNRRRDNAPILKICFNGVIRHILFEHSVQKAVDHVTNVLTKMLNDEYTMDKFIISKNLKANYKKPHTIAHKVLADRMKDRDPGNAPQVGDRIPFIHIVKRKVGKGKKKILQGDLIEDPKYVKENNLKIDYLYYIRDQIKKPVRKILKLGMKNSEKVFDKFIMMEDDKQMGRTDISDFLELIMATDESDKSDDSVVDTDSESESSSDSSSDENSKSKSKSKIKRKAKQKSSKTIEIVDADEIDVKPTNSKDKSKDKSKVKSKSKSKIKSDDDDSFETFAYVKSK